MTLPNFLIVGAAKAGTTSLYHYLARHPQVFLARDKEPHFFAPAKWCGRPTPGRAQYEALFEGAHGFRAIGEASTGYLYYPESPRLIHELIPDCRIVAILRNPVERAFSGYCHELREGVETVSFEQALAEERQHLRIIRGGDFSFNYVKQGIVSHLLAEYRERFGPQRVHLCLYDDLVAAPAELMRALMRFLGIDETLRGDWSYRYNPSGVPRFRWLHELLDGEGRWRAPLAGAARALLPARAAQAAWHRLRDWNVRIGPRPVLRAQTRAMLNQTFAPEVAALERLTGRDLRGWLADPAA